MSAYWIAHVNVLEEHAYSRYRELAPAAFAKYGARFLARGGAAETLEGPDYARHVVIEFPDLESAKACYQSPEYQAARAERAMAAETSVTIVDGL